jgi:hypothetical protein
MFRLGFRITLGVLLYCSYLMKNFSCVQAHTTA